MHFFYLIFSSSMDPFLKMLQLLLVVLSFLTLNSVTMATRPFVQEPQSQAVTIYESVSFVCIRHPEETCNVLWYLVDAQVYLTRNKAILEAVGDSPGHPHYSLPANDTQDFTLTIHNVTLSDAGSYQCVCYGTSLYVPDIVADLTVNVPPLQSYPSCRMSEREESLFVGQSINFHCSSSGGRPPAVLKWIRGNNEVFDAEYSLSPHPRSIYQTYLKPQDFGKVFTCVASSPALKTPRNCSVGPLYPTSVVQVDIIPEIGLTEKQHPLSFGCSANFTEFGVRDYPPVLNYSWYINDYLVEYGMDGIILDSDKQFMFLNQTSHLPHNSQISCEAFGPAGSLGNATVMINEKFGLDQSSDGYQEVTKPTVLVVGRKRKTKFDIRPIVFINAGGLMLLATMILIVVCVPKQCRCFKKPRSHLRRRDSRYADMQFTQTNGCPSPLLMTPENNMNTYESTDSDTESSKGMSGNGNIPTVTSMSQQQQQQVQATLHVVVHSANNQQQTTTLKACSSDDYDEQHSLYHELPPMPSTPPPPPPPPDQPGSPTKKKGGYSSPVKAQPNKTSPTKTWGPRTTRSHSVLSYDHVPAQQNQYAPTTCTTTSTTAGCYVRTLPLPGHNGKLIQSCLRCNHGNKSNNNHFATYHRGDHGVGVVYENIPLPPHTCDCPPPAPL